MFKFRHACIWGGFDVEIESLELIKQFGQFFSGLSVFFLFVVIQRDANSHDAENYKRGGKSFSRKGIKDEAEDAKPRVGIQPCEGGRKESAGQVQHRA